MNARTKTRSSLRDHLPRQRRPTLLLEGAQRKKMLAAYIAQHAFIFIGLAYTLSWSPLLCLGAVVLCYLLENVLFIIGHVGLHVSFIETPESQMTTVTHHSFYHHYRDTVSYTHLTLPTSTHV